MNLYGPPPEITKHMIEKLVKLDYEDDFIDWMCENWSIWTAFHRRAKRMQMTGRSHYGARTIMELLRWESDLNDKDSTFKINNNVIPMLARLYNDLSDTDFFMVREQGKQAA